jgi:enterochelin esterase-like enzyme
MHKRQAFPRLSISTAGVSLILLIIILAIGGCSGLTPSQNAVQVLPTQTSADIPPTQTPPADEHPTQSPTAIIPTPDCLSEGGSIQEYRFYSDILMAEFLYKIYLPPCYDANPEGAYPVLYLLHGLSYDDQQWVRLGLVDKMDALINAGEISPFIVVLPTEARFDPPETSSFADVLVRELLPEVESHFHILTEKRYYAIGGLSRGAAWAVRIGMDNPALFSRVGAHSLPLFNADVSHVQTWLTRIPKEDLPSFFIDIGRDDPEWQSAQSFATQLDQNGVPHEWYLFNNGHSESYWANHLAQYLRWYGAEW